MHQHTTLHIQATTAELLGLTPLFREGVTICLTGGRPLRHSMTQDLGLAPDCVEERVQTVFLDGSPVDDIDADQVTPGCTLALAGALPGVAGIAMRRGSPVGAFREGITHHASTDQSTGAQVAVTLKLFNSVALECLTTVLARGVQVRAARLMELLETDPDVLNGARFELEGVSMDRPALLLALHELPGILHLQATETFSIDPRMETLARIAEEAGAAIMKVRTAGFTVEYKADASPLTRADTASHEVIMRGLTTHFPGVPVLSEEGVDLPFAVRGHWRQLFIVDPLDGTKEFVKELGEFCVCIALAQEGFPALGAVHAPVSGATYVGGLGLGAYKRTIAAGAPAWQSICVREPDPTAGLSVLASRSHPSPETEAWLADKKVRERITAGSALKFCLVAEGAADLYPRFNPTREWDTAAGQAVLEGAGGSVRTPNGARMPVNKRNLLNGGFFASATPL